MASALAALHLSNIITNEADETRRSVGRSDCWRPDNLKARLCFIESSWPLEAQRNADSLAAPSTQSERHWGYGDRGEHKDGIMWDYSEASLMGLRMEWLHHCDEY